MLQTRRLCLVLCSLHLIGLCTVSGISMTVNPATVVLGSTAPSQTQFRCDGISESDIQSSIGMTMAKFVSSTSSQVFATAGLTKTSFTENTAPPTMRSRQTPPVLDGGIDQNTASQTFFSVSFETNEMRCNDAGTYVCSYTYTGNDNAIHTVEDQKNLSISANPSDMILTASKAGMVGVNLAGTINSPFAMKVNESISFTCHGKIGSEKDTVIRWEMSSLTSENSNQFMQFIGDEGSPNTTPEDCSYSRTATMTYSTVLADAGRKNYLAFKCYAGLGQNRAESSTIFYIKVEGSGTGGNGGTGAISGGDAANAGAIAGGVVGAVVAIVIIVLLVYFLWYRRRSGGDTYRTKEESGPDNPNMAPSTDDLYAKPKDKNRDSNDKHGMDEDYNYRDADDYNRGRSRGRENRALDTDSYNSRDGSPTMHMGGGHIGTGV